MTTATRNDDNRFRTAGEVKRTLRELAFVLHAVRQVKEEITATKLPERGHKVAGVPSLCG